MATAAAIFQHQLTAGRALSPGLLPMDASSPASGSNGTSGSDSGSATISANDFLTLLVTEMQNQDPTANTDPNEYINQLVQVNSLEQLIDINQTLSGALDSSSDPSGSTGSGTPATQAAGASTSPAHINTGANSASAPGSATAQNLSGANAAHLVHRAGGNLSIPSANPAAQRVGHALDGRTRASGAAIGGTPGAL